MYIKLELALGFIKMRVGIGYDIHRLKIGKRLVLGGIVIPYESGLIGHSDADVLIHSMCDAILGAASLGDLGDNFPDTDQIYKNICSLNLLKSSYEKIMDENLEIVNIDAVIFAQQPVISPYKLEMRKKIANKLEININQISIKATTTERLGVIGVKKGIAAMSIALLM